MKKIQTKIKWGMVIVLSVQLIACSDSGNAPASQSTAPETTTANSESENTASDIGVGPVKSVTLGEIDPNLVNKGKEIYEAKCTACHEIDKRKVGPAIKGITQRRKPEWIMNMILNPSEMTQKDPAAKELLGTYGAPMANQNLTEDEARAVLEFFRDLDKN